MQVTKINTNHKNEKKSTKRDVKHPRCVSRSERTPDHE